MSLLMEEGGWLIPHLYKKSWILISACWKLNSSWTPWYLPVDLGIRFPVLVATWEPLCWEHAFKIRFYLVSSKLILGITKFTVQIPDSPTTKILALASSRSQACLMRSCLDFLEADAVLWVSSSDTVVSTVPFPGALSSGYEGKWVWTSRATELEALEVSTAPDFYGQGL